MYRVGIDIGGTFTDMLLVGDDGSAVIAKTLTTPGDPSLAVENALRPVLENGSVDPRERGTLIHGTTLVTNALIERKGALTALLTTAGFRDAVEIGREHLRIVIHEQHRCLTVRHRHAQARGCVSLGTLVGTREIDLE